MFASMTRLAAASLIALTGLTGAGVAPSGRVYWV